jgi:hypothetical protein
MNSNFQIDSKFIGFPKKKTKSPDNGSLPQFQSEIGIDRNLPRCLLPSWPMAKRQKWKGSSRDKPWLNHIIRIWLSTRPTTTRFANK